MKAARKARAAREVREAHLSYSGVRGSFRLTAPDPVDGLPASCALPLCEADIAELRAKLGEHQARLSGLADDKTVAAASAFKTFKDAAMTAGAKFGDDATEKVIGQLFENPQGREVWGRMVVTTDGPASSIPVEALFLPGMNCFAVGQPNNRFSVVRDVGHEAKAPLAIPARPWLERLTKGPAPLEMLAVFSLRDDHVGGVGTEQQGATTCLAFTGAAQAEAAALVRPLAPLIRLGLLRVSFLVGTPDGLYRGTLVARAAEARWEVVEGPVDAPDLKLKGEMKTQLEDQGPRIFYYYGHGSFDGKHGAVLALEPGQPCSSGDLNEIFEAIGELRGDSTEWRANVAPRYAVLNACMSAQAADARHGPLGGFPATFFRWGTVALVGQQMDVSPETATLVTARVFAELAKSLFTDPMGIEVALRQVRLDRLAQGKGDFFCPVLYRRRVSGPVFTYADRRLPLWRMLRAERVSVRPWITLRLMIWRWKTRKLMPARRATGRG